MVDFTEDFESWLRGRAPIADLVGASANARIFPDVLRQAAAMPAIVYQEVGGESVVHLTTQAGLCRAVFHLYCFGSTRSQANELAEVVKAELIPFKGRMGSHTISEITASQHRDCDVDLAQDGSSAARYWTRRIFDIWHSEII